MSNAYDSTRGNTTDRQRRKQWLLETYRADVDYNPRTGDWCSTGLGIPACRCYRCGKLLTIDQIIADRIIPAAAGGTYRRNNIRPSCKRCSDKSGNEVKRANRRS